jgi:hypothetical protein
MDRDGKPSRQLSLMEGGPLYRIQERVGLGRERAHRTLKIALLLPLLTWLPLLLLSVIQGTAWGSSVRMAFLQDFSAYTRFLLAIPLLLAGEVVVGPLIADAAEHFIISGVVGAKDYPAFDRAVEKSLRLRDSGLAEIVMLLAAYCLSLMAFRTTAVQAPTWFAARTGTSDSMTLAGWWLVLFCVPLYQFLILRWLWRAFLWFQFLHQISKLDLYLYPTHPDQAGGLGFVGHAQRLFSILLFSYSVGAAGVIANEIVYDKIPLQHFAVAIATYVVVALIVILGPLVIFTGKLLKTKRVGLQEYGTLATTYTGSFQRKWIGAGPPDRGPLLGTADIQSLADLGNSYSLIEHMNVLPVNPRTPIQLAIASLVPLTPLLLTVMPAKEVAKLLFKVIM